METPVVETPASDAWLEEDFGDYNVRRMHSWYEVWSEDFEVQLFTIPATIPADQIKTAIRIYEAGLKDGKEQGRRELQRDLRKLLGAAPL